jgi:tetratricopeptide (TPR) repeat protein
VQCLYCGKGISPIRLLRDLEFCSEAHRTQARERYRRQAYEALAPEPAPARLADFLERPAVKSGPAPTAVLRALPNSAADRSRPALPVPVAGISVERPDWLYAQRLAAMPTRLARLESTSSIPSPPSPIRVAPLSMRIEAPRGSAAGAAPTLLTASASTAQPQSAAPRNSGLRQSPPHSVSLPDATGIPKPGAADPSSPELRAAVPAGGDPAAVGALPASIRAANPRRNPAIAGPTAPPALASASEAGLSPALMASLPRPLEAGPLPPQFDLKTVLNTGLPVAFEAAAPRGMSRSLGIILPKPPALAESSSWMTPTSDVQPQRANRLSAAAGTALVPAAPAPACVLPGLPGIQAALPAGEQIESAVQQLALAPMAATPDLQPAGLPPASPTMLHHVGQALSSAHPLAPAPARPQALAPMGALAELVQPGSAAIHQATGNRKLRSDIAPSPAPVRTPAPPNPLSALPAAPLGEMSLAPARQAEALASAAPPAAVPSWNATQAAFQAHSPALAALALPRINCLPAPAGAIDLMEAPSRPEAARAVRSSAALWALRVVRLCTPDFSMSPIKARLKDLARASRSTSFNPDLEDQIPAKKNVRLFKRPGLPRLSRRKWQYIGAAAAALLLGVLLPKASPKISAASLPWRGVSVRQWLSQRATRTFADDFRAGLNQWKGVQPKWPKSWSYSTDGFIHPGQLALYRPSVPLSDYRFEFMAQIENKSVDWVVRAQDADNYYALKFTVVQPGPRPMVAMVHYPVVGGHQGARVLTPLRMMIHANTPYRVTVDVKGNRFRAFIEDQEADFWTDDKLKTGGVGFFSDAGERARVYWVKIESHGDILGRICSLLSGKSNGGTPNKEIQAMDYRHAGTTDVTTGASPNAAETAIDTAQETRISRVLSKAASLHLDGKLDEAAKELIRALDGGERHPALYFALGQLQYELQEYRPASQSYAQAALLQPMHPTAHFNAGVCLGRIERWKDATAAFRKAISNDPARSEAHLALGACLVQLGLHHEALEAYDRFLEHHPDHDEALFGKAVALQKRDRGSEAAELYRRILTRNPQSEEALSNLVSLGLANQDYDQVRKYAQRLAEAQPKSQIALEGLAGAAFAAGDHKAAADYSRQLAELAPQVFENWFNLGVACHKAGDLANASKAYARATRVQSDSPQAHLNLGVALQEQGDLKAARSAYQRALQIDPKLAGVHWNLGLVHEQLGESEAAEKLYAQVPENSPDFDDAAFRIGHLRLERGEYPGSIQAFESCLEKRPNWPEARLNLGIAHWRAGDKEAARTAFQALTASGADSKEALRGLAALSLEHQEYDKAFEIYRQLLDSGERTPELLYNAGLICQRRGEAEDAAVLYKEAIKADPQFGEALLNLGHALMSLGNEFEARSCWRKAVIAKPELAQRYFEPAAQAS